MFLLASSISPITLLFGRLLVETVSSLKTRRRFPARWKSRIPLQRGTCVQMRTSFRNSCGAEVVTCTSTSAYKSVLLFSAEHTTDTCKCKTTAANSGVSLLAAFLETRKTKIPRTNLRTIFQRIHTQVARRSTKKTSVHCSIISHEISFSKLLTLLYIHNT